MSSVLDLIMRIDAYLPERFKLFRIVQIFIAIVYLLYALGSTVYWMFRYLGEERHVPLGYSTFRALNWPLSDFLLLFCCFYAAVTVGLNKPTAKKGCLIGGIAFIIQGLIAIFIDSSIQHQQQFGVDSEELQSMSLSLWFVGWGSFSAWMGIFGLPLLQAKLDTQVL